MLHLHKLGLVLQHRAKVLVGLRSLVADARVGVADDALHGRLKVRLWDQVPGFCARHAAPRAMRAALPGALGPATLDDVAAHPHAPGDDAILPRACAGGALARDPEVPLLDPPGLRVDDAAALALAEVVVRVHRTAHVGPAAGDLLHAADHELQHATAILPGVGLAPQHVLEVALASLACDVQIIQGACHTAEEVALFAGDPVVVRGRGVAHVSAATVQHAPHLPVRFGIHHFEEMVAAPQCSELLGYSGLLCDTSLQVRRRIALVGNVLQGLLRPGEGLRMRIEGGRNPLLQQLLDLPHVVG
mmetsp:Transcript_16146/g.48688  ORF Transcript_16146/g.48688 Transcript_16146/m.48688 type:complete len:303 (-) Transcript_16146:534-1442(-)